MAQIEDILYQQQNDPENGGYYFTNDVWRNQTPQSAARIKQIQDMAAQGAISGNDANALMNEIFGTDFLAQEQENRLQKQLQSLQLGQLYGELGDPITSELYLKNSLPKKIRSRISGKKQAPSFLERLAAMGTVKPQGPLDLAASLRAMYAYQNPEQFGAAKRPDQSGLDYLLESTAFGTPDTRSLGAKPNVTGMLDDMYSQYGVQ